MTLRVLPKSPSKGMEYKRPPLPSRTCHVERRTSSRTAAAGAMPSTTTRPRYSRPGAQHGTAGGTAARSGAASSDAAAPSDEAALSNKAAPSIEAFASGAASASDAASAPGAAFASRSVLRTLDQIPSAPIKTSNGTNSTNEPPFSVRKKRATSGDSKPSKRRPQCICVVERPATKAPRSRSRGSTTFAGRCAVRQPLVVSPAAYRPSTVPCSASNETCSCGVAPSRCNPSCRRARAPCCSVNAYPCLRCDSAESRS
mmetsp:Transcript_13915/g.49388  ORF Transcript_13915/g.49388 Transcript_13915/m.49388 type:complete len:257 (-) Transcript_13915:96-866(-)